MKTATATATLFLASFLVLLFTSAAAVAAYDDVILDVVGNELQKGVPYYILPPIWGPLGGPVKFSTPVIENETCQVDVVQDPFEVGIGTPFTLTPVATNQNVINASYPIAIESPSENPCDKSTIWKLDSREGIPVDIVTTGGIFNTPSSCFRIVKPTRPLFGWSYMLENCPFMCGPGVKMCYPIGIFNVNGISHLSSFGRSFEVVFLKALEPAIAMDYGLREYIWNKRHA